MRITMTTGRLLALASLGLALGLGVCGPAAAQDTTQDQQTAPPKFGPRAGQQQGQPGQDAPSDQAGQPGQPGQPPQPQVDVIAENGKWKVQCESAPAMEGQPATRQCGMIQATASEKNPKATLTLVMVKTKQGDKSLINMRLITPIGVFLPTGVGLEIDGATVGRVPFTRCMPQICMAFAEATPETLAKLKKGKEASFFINEAPGVTLPMKLSLDGFSASLAALDKASN